MSPLTPTLPETQTPIIPTGSFPALPDFATKVQEALDLIDPSDMELVIQKKQEIEQQKAHLTALLEELKESQKDYDFSDYEERLLLSDAEIENILENEIFRKDGELTELGKSFYEYLENVTKGKNEELKGKMERKLVKELRLDDRVYEANIWFLEGTEWELKIGFKNKKEFFEQTQEVGRSGITSLQIIYTGLSEKLEASDFIRLVQEVWGYGIKHLDLWISWDHSEKFEASDFIELTKQAGLSGIKHLDPWSYNHSENLEAPDFIELVQEAGRSGIKILELWFHRLSKKLEASDFIELTKQAGLSGIKSLDLLNNGLSEKLEASDLIELVQEAGRAGIIHLGLWGNELFKKLEVTDFIELTKQAGLSGINSLDLRNNDLFRKLEAQDFITLVWEAGRSGIKSLDLWANIRSNEPKASDVFIELVQEAGWSGIKNLSLACNYLAQKLSASQKNEMDNIAKKYNMKLDYSD